MMDLIRQLLLFGVAASLLGIESAGVAWAAGPSDSAQRRDIEALRVADLEARGACDEVLAVHRRVARENARDARISLAAGRCALRARDHVAAAAALEEAKELDPALGGVDLQLGMARYHVGDLDGARRAFAAARAAGEEGPLLDLYSGLLLLQANDARAAALSLERARRADARAVEPVASYYAFLAWRSLADEGRARAALDRVRASDPDGPWTAEAERILAQRPPGTQPRAWGAAQVGMEYDSNVVLLGSGLSASAFGISRKDDGRGVWSLDGGVELFRTEDWSGGLLGAYTGSAHFTIHELDIEYPTVSAWLDRRIDDETSLRLRYDYGYAWVDYDSYLSSNRVSGSVLHGWETAGTTELLASGFRHAFLYDWVPVAGAACQDLDQDGVGITGEVEHRYSPGWRALELRAGYRFTHYDSQGCEYSHDAHRFQAGARMGLGWDVELDTAVSFSYEPYENPSAYLQASEPEVKRRDRIWRTSVGLERPIGRSASVIARYSHTDTGSNTNVYDYDQHVVGLHLRFTFD